MFVEEKMVNFILLRESLRNDGFRFELNSFGAFLEDYKCSIYSFRGEEINLSGRIPYSTVWYENKTKSLFSRKAELHTRAPRRVETVTLITRT